jgi:hypothetical protein
MLSGKHEERAMGWYDDLIAGHEKQIANLQQAIAWMEDGTLGTGDIENGRRKDTTAESIAWYRRMVADLETLVAKIKDGTL